MIFQIANKKIIAAGNTFHWKGRTPREREKDNKRRVRETKEGRLGPFAVSPNNNTLQQIPH